MTVVAYARVSTDDQTLDAQVEALKSAGADIVFAEKESGGSRDKRSELAGCLASLQAGDVLIVTKLDRLARSMPDLTSIVSDLVARGVGFRCLHQSAIDTASLTGRLMLNILGAFAEFELGIIAERRAEGIARAKLAGKYKGRKPIACRLEARRMKRDEPDLTARDLATRLGCSEKTAYRYTAGLWGM